ncbi:MAG TPA: hypothetical protein VN648_26775 [Candidatus Methylomirabilis sp.]|nr:hypothetical protein [Candidatus Methylomirabilis sp.]
MLVITAEIANHHGAVRSGSGPPEGLACIALMPDYACMWLAVCRNQKCRWEQSASSKVSAELYAQAHQLEHEGKWEHRVLVIKIRDKSPPSRNSPADAP